MKLVIVGPAYPIRGGISHHNTLFYKHLSQKCDTKIFSFKRQYPDFLFPGKTQYETGKPAIKISPDNNIRVIDSINPINWILTALRIRKEKPEVLIFRYWHPFFAPCYYTISLIVKIFSGTKVLYICDNVIPHEKSIFDNILIKTAFSTVDFFLVQSNAVEKDLKKFNKKNKPYKVSPHPLYNMFGEAISKKDAINVLQKEFNIDFKESKIILFFGFIRAYKGLDYLLDAMPEILKKHDIKLIVAGEFYEDEKPYKQKILDAKLEDKVVLLTSYMPDEKVKFFFSACDCLVLPYTNATQSGIVQIAYSFDKPAIVSDVGGLSEVVINEKTGLIVKPRDSKSVSNAVIRFFDENLEAKFSENIKIVKKNYSWDTFVNNVLELIKS